MRVAGSDAAGQMLFHVLTWARVRVLGPGFNSPLSSTFEVQSVITPPLVVKRRSPRADTFLRERPARGAPESNIGA